MEIINLLPESIKEVYEILLNVTAIVSLLYWLIGMIGAIWEFISFQISKKRENQCNKCNPSCEE